MFSSSNLKDLRNESVLFFKEILNKNLPLETFIKPDFAFLSSGTAQKFYGIKKVKSKNLTRVSLPADSPYGGILGMASVMMATANGVDTEPVLRGVWVLENVLGTPPPPPPNNIPAITPDTRGAKTIRDLLEAHRADEKLRQLSQKKSIPSATSWKILIPSGAGARIIRSTTKMVKTGNGPEINTNATMINGTELNHINDLKAEVLENIDQFAECLGEKILTYATGRELSYSDRFQIKQIVHESLKAEHGFQDFILALINAKVFRTK